MARRLDGTAIAATLMALAVHGGCRAPTTEGSSSGATSSGGSGAVSSSSSSDSGSSSSSRATSPSAPTPTFQELCQTIAGLNCEPVTCRDPAGFVPDAAVARDDCLRYERRRCAEDEADVERLVDAGLAQVDPAAALACAEAWRQYRRELDAARCENYDAYAEHGIFWGNLVCDDGWEMHEGGLWEQFVSCERVVTGAIPVDGGCGDDFACQSGVCDADGGCGRCLADHGVTGAPRGAPCRRTRNGVTESVECALGLSCDINATYTCLPIRGAGERCGAQVGECSKTCGYMCANVTTHESACVPSPGEGERCWCGSCTPGYTCVLSPEPPRCRPHASLGQPCGFGFNYDEYRHVPGMFQTGGCTYESLPVCGVGMACELSGAGSNTGTCRLAGPRDDFASCTVADYCAATNSVCYWPQVPGAWCYPRATAGGRCNSDEGCATGTFCTDVDGGIGRCEASRDDGSPCARDAMCGTYSRCRNRTCTYLLDEQSPSLPLCQ